MGTITTAGSSQKHLGLLYPLMLIAAIALIIFSIVGIATMMGWMPGTQSGNHPPDKAAAVPGTTLRADAAPPCNDCGVIESIREPQVAASGKSAESYQIRVRMGDGATRIFYESRQPALAIGQRVRVTERGIAPAG